MVIHEHVIKTEYKGMIAPDNMIGISTMRTVPELTRLHRKRKLTLPTNIITNKEIELLKRMCKFQKK